MTRLPTKILVTLLIILVLYAYWRCLHPKLRTPEIWLFANNTALIDGHWKHFPKSTTSGLQEIHNLFPYVATDIPTVTVHLAANTVFPLTTPLYLTNNFILQGGGMASSIIKWTGPTDWTSLAAVATNPAANAMITTPFHGIGPGGFFYGVGNFEARDVGFQSAKNFPVCLVYNAAEHSDVEQCAFMGPDAFSPFGNYQQLVLKEDMATSRSAIIGMAFNGADKAIIRGNVFAGLADGFYAFHSGDHYEFSENDGGSIGEFCNNHMRAFGTAYPPGNVLALGCLVVDMSGKDCLIERNHVTFGNGMLFMDDHHAYGVTATVRDNLCESCRHYTYFVTPGALVHIEGQIDVGDRAGMSCPITVFDPVSFQPTTADAPGVLSDIAQSTGRIFLKETWMGTNLVSMIDIMGNPNDDYVLHANYAAALLHLGHAQKAVHQLNEALQLKPDSTPVMNNLAWVLATSPDANVRDGARAVQLAERACEITGYKQTILVGTLAAAYAEAGRFDDATATAEKACALAASSGEQDLLQKTRQLLELYRAHKPYHEADGGR